MAQETALGRIIAGALLLVDRIVGCFADVGFTSALLNCDSNTCGASSYEGSLTSCGEYVADQLTIAVAALAGLGANLLPALGI
jgi:hypothetical protein